MTEPDSIEYIQAERDMYKRRAEEMQKAILKLPQPPHETGDGPDERVGHALTLLAKDALLQMHTLELLGDIQEIVDSVKRVEVDLKSLEK